MTTRYEVLLVDDATELRDLIRESLEIDPRFVVTGMAGNGREGVAEAARLQPDVILLDLAMPEMDGLSALPLLRSASPDARIVVLSGFQRAPLAAAVIAGGAVGYLEKGGSPTELRSELLMVLGVLDSVHHLASRAAGLPADATSPRQARRFVTEALNEWNCAAALDTVALLTSELVTNAVVHAKSTPQIVVQATEHQLRIEVHDQELTSPVRRVPDAAGPGGRGLLLLDELATEWGVEPRPGGKAVWFTVARPTTPADEVDDA